jgi:hypothetical protein
MKRYYDLSKQELNDLSNEDIQRYIDIEIAYAGIIPVRNPEQPAIFKPSIEPKEVAYEVHGNLFKNADDAMTFSKMDKLSAEYNWSKAGSDYKWLEPKTDYDGGVKTVKFYKKEDIASIVEELTASRKAKELYDADLKEYNKYCEKISTIQTSIIDAIREARYFFSDVKAAKSLYDKYIKLADGNVETATNFIKDAYKDKQEILDELLGKEVTEDQKELKSEE